MNNLKSYTEYAVTSSTTDFVIGFDFNYGTDAVTVTVDGVPATDVGYTVVYLNSTTMRLTPAVPTGVVRLQRETDIDVPDNSFTAGAKFIASNMDENFTQIRHAQQEVRDGFNKLAVDTNAIIDTLQDVGQAAQDAADAAEAAAQTANDAAAQVNDKVSYQDLDNAVEAAVAPVKNNTAYFYPTVAQMIAATNLADGAVVATKSYHNISDSGGATYLISSVATDYSIPLSNGLHAVFRDTFDIRKFGIVSSKTLDQTENIRRMIAYADSREYEIDFHNYEIMTPDIIQYTSVGGAIYRGMGFNHPHKIKNVKPVNNKSIPIYQGTIPIQFLPKNKGSGETFELENVRFDLYVADQIFISGEGDGRFHGFYAGWHPDYPVGWPNQLRSECGYKFKANGIYIDTPAVTSTMALNIWFSDIEFKNMFGDFIGYYTTHFGTRVTAENCHGTYRDDLHAAGRNLVTNFFQEEQEVGTGGFVYSQDYQKFKNISSRKYSTGEIRGAIKRQIMGLPTLGKFEAEDIVGRVDWQSTGQNLLINAIDISKANNVTITCSFEKATLRDLTVSGYVLTNRNATHGDLILDNVIVNFPVAAAVSLPSIELVNGCKLNNIIVDSGTQVTSITAKNLKSYTYRILIGNINSIYLDDWHHTPSGTFTSSCINTSAVSAKITIINSNIQDPQALTTSNAFIKAVNTDANTKLDLSVINTYMTQKPGLQLGLGVLTWVNSSPAFPVEVTYDPPSLAAAGTAGDTATTTVTLTGAVVGDNVSAAFSRYNAGIRIYPVVNAANTVTVEFRNISAAPIDLGSGTLAVKLI